MKSRPKKTVSKKDTGLFTKAVIDAIRVRTDLRAGEGIAPVPTGPVRPNLPADPPPVPAPPVVPLPR